MEQRPDDPLVVEWVQQAIAWVKSAAKRDDIEVIVQFGMLSLNWELSDTERVKVLVRTATQRALEDHFGDLRVAMHCERNPAIANHHECRRAACHNAGLGRFPASQLSSGRQPRLATSALGNWIDRWLGSGTASRNGIAGMERPEKFRARAESEAELRPGHFVLVMSMD